jgi:hypothetical protein
MGQPVWQHADDIAWKRCSNDQADDRQRQRSDAGEPSAYGEGN